MNELLALINQHNEQFSDEFAEWLPVNEHVWRAFVNEAMKVRARGRTHYSSYTIVEFLRHNSAVQEVGGEWKINNNHSPYLARLFDLMFPAFAGMWEYRETKKVNRK